MTSVIARDRPDILEEIKEGKHRSTRAAAVKAGIVKDEYKMTISGVDPNKAAKTILSAIESGKITRDFMDEVIGIYRGVYDHRTRNAPTYG